MSKHDYKNLAGFLDTTRKAPTWASHVQIHPFWDGDSAELFATDGIKLASILMEGVEMDSCPPLLIEDGAGFLKAAALTAAVQVVAREGRHYAYVGDSVFEATNVPTGRNYKLLRAQCLADHQPCTLQKLGFYSPHAATLGKVKDSRNKPAVIQLGFRQGHIVFTTSGSTLTGVITSNSLMTEEQPPEGQLI